MDNPDKPTGWIEPIETPEAGVRKDCLSSGVPEAKPSDPPNRGLVAGV